MGGNRNKIIERLRQKLEKKKTQDVRNVISGQPEPVVINGIVQPPIALKKEGSDIDPMVEQFLKQLTPEQLAEYKRQGEHMYGFDYVNAGTENGEAMEYIKIALRSGLLPDSLNDDEKEFLKGIYGDDWPVKVVEAL